MTIQLYWIDLDWPGWAGRRELLSGEEQARVDRYVFEHDRRRALAGWAARRLVLAGLLDLPAPSLIFGQQAEGRPFLVDQTLQFNLSHSSAQALLAVAPAGEFGVDIEFIGRVVELEQLARRFFHPAEIAHLAEEGFSAPVFFRIWTAKEAYLKAIGTGLRRPLDSFTVVEGSSPWVLCQPPGEVLPGWTLTHFSHPGQSDYRGCLCAFSSHVQITQAEFWP